MENAKPSLVSYLIARAAISAGQEMGDDDMIEVGQRFLAHLDQQPHQSPVPAIPQNPLVTSRPNDGGAWRNQGGVAKSNSLERKEGDATDSRISGGLGDGVQLRLNLPDPARCLLADFGPTPDFDPDLLRAVRKRVVSQFENGRG